MSPTLRAALWMIGAIVSFTSMAIAGRAVSLDLDTFEIMLYRSLIGIVVVLAVAGWAGTLHQVSAGRWRLHLARNLAHFAGQNLWFFALTVIPLAQVFAFEFTTPIWVLLLSPLLLGEPIRRAGAIAAAIGFVGILIVARPSPESLNAGVLAAALCAVSFAITSLLTRKLTRSDSITSILIWLTGLQAVLGLICAGMDADIALPTAANLPWLVLIGLSGLAAHFCLTTALSLAPAAVVTPIDFARLPLIAVIGALFYAEPIDSSVIIGGALILAANWLNLTRGQTAARRDILP